MTEEALTIRALPTPQGHGFTAYILNGDKVLASCKHDYVPFGKHDGEYYARRCAYEMVGRLFSFLDLVGKCELVAGGTTTMLRPCPDCGVPAGELHVTGCDMERCGWCGGQAIACECVFEVNGVEYDEDEKATPEMWEEFGKLLDTHGAIIPWTGEDPHRADCRRLGFWYYNDYSKPQGPERMVRCGPEHPEAREDLNRLFESAVWNRDLGRFEAR